MEYNFTCSRCNNTIKSGSLVYIKGTAPNNKEWKTIFFKGMKGIQAHFQVLCSDCNEHKEQNK